jgi:trimeric autotransporter adhesin
MGRSGSVGSVIVLLILALGWSGCGNDSSGPATDPVPASLTLSPKTDVSLEIGKIQNFTVAAVNASNAAITTPIAFTSSNTAIVTIAANGAACAGTWNSLSNPQLCTPGAEGTAQITATAQGVSSPPTTVWVHQHIAKLTIGEVTVLDPNSPMANAHCISKGSKFVYQVLAKTTSGVDISSTIGIPTWQLSTAIVGTVNTVSTTDTPLLPGQVELTANTPGTSQLFASVAGAASIPIPFVTCPVQQITLEADNTPVNSLSFNSSGSKTLTAVVVDTSGTTITGVPLTWTSSRPTSVTVTNGAVSGSKPGGATVIASCTPPTCNLGFQPSLPIYPINPVAVSVTGTSAATTVLLSTNECGAEDDCVSQIVGIDTTANTVSNTFALTATPNSIVFNPQGTKAFVGTNKSLLGSKGLMVVDLSASPTTITTNNSVPGKVLAVSPDGTRVIVSDTADTVNQVFIFNANDNSNVALPIAGVSAAGFSPDNLKAFIAAGNKLYIFSTQDALQTVTLGVPATGIAYLPGGMGAYLAGGDAAGLAFLPTCGTQPPTVTGVADPGAQLIEALPDGRSIFSVISPTVQLVKTVLPTPPLTLPVGQDGCPAPRGAMPLSFDTNHLVTQTDPVDLGQGPFTPTQLIISADGAAAYILTSNSPNILVFDINNRITTAIQLANDAIPLQGGLTTDGKKLYVAGSDGQVHVLDTPTAADAVQITLPQPLCTSESGLNTFTCKPNLVAVKP